MGGLDIGARRGGFYNRITILHNQAITTASILRIQDNKGRMFWAYGANDTSNHLLCARTFNIIISRLNGFETFRRRLHHVGRQTQTD